MSNLQALRRTILLRPPEPRLIVLLLGLASVSGVAQSAAPKSVAMQDMTVPKERLPDGCSLKVIEPGHREVIVTFPDGSQRVNLVGATPSRQPMGVTANPWTGTNRRILAELRRSIDGYGELPFLDAPPLTSSEGASIFATFANGVQEGYAATYVQSGGPDLGVWAVRFAVAPEAHFDFPTGSRRSRQKIIDIGTIRVALFDDGGACSSAIETYLKSVAK